MTSLVLTIGPIGRRQTLLLLRGGFRFCCLFLSILLPIWIHGFILTLKNISFLRFNSAQNFIQISSNAFKRLKLNEVTGRQHGASGLYYNLWGETSRTSKLLGKLTLHNTLTFCLGEGQIPTLKILVILEGQPQFLLSHFSCLLWYLKWRCQHKVPRQNSTSADQSKMAEGFKRPFFHHPSSGKLWN